MKILFLTLAFLLVSQFASAQDRACRDLPKAAWHNGLAEAGVGNLPRSIPAKEVYLQAMCGVMPETIWNLVERGEGALLTIPTNLANALHAATPYLAPVRYMYVRGGGVDREVVVFLFADGYFGPIFRFDQNLAWDLPAVEQAVTYWELLPYEFLRLSAQWLHDLALFNERYEVVINLFFIKLKVFTMTDGRGLASPLGSVLTGRCLSGCTSNLLKRGAYFWIHELAHFVHYDLFGIRPFMFVDEFTRITRRNHTIFGIPIPFWFAQIYPQAVIEEEEHSLCEVGNYPHRPWGHVSVYARCGEWSTLEDFADTLSIAVGTANRIRETVRLEELGLTCVTQGECENRCEKNRCPRCVAGKCKSILDAYTTHGSNTYHPNGLYGRSSDSDGSVLGFKVAWMRDRFSFHPYSPMDADANGVEWSLGAEDVDCDDSNPVAGRCISLPCGDDTDCDDRDTCTVGTCRAGICEFETVDSDDDGSPDGACGGTDCDDNDPMIFAGSRRPCTSPCGLSGDQVCVNARWTECSAPDSCTCVPGEVYEESCGNCGVARRVCPASGMWPNQPGACQGEGVCRIGQTRTELCNPAGAGCVDGSRIDTCDSTCQWAQGECRASSPQPEVCNGADDDCDGFVDEGCPRGLTWVSSDSSPVYGGNAPTNPPQMTTNCPADQIIRGFRLNRGYCCFPRRDVIGNIAATCGRVELNTSGNPYTYEVRILNGDVLPTHGQAVDGFIEWQCPANQAVMKAEVSSGWYVDKLRFTCGTPQITGNRGSYAIQRTTGAVSPSYWSDGFQKTYTCPQNSFMKGITTTSGNILDSIQFTCAVPGVDLR